MCRKKKSVPILLKCIDVTRATQTNLDVVQEKRVDEYWNVDAKSKFIRFLDRIHEVHITEQRTFQGIYVFREESDKDSSNWET